MKIKVTLIKIIRLILIKLIKIGMGRSKVISMSKIRKITAIK